MTKLTALILAVLLLVAPSAFGQAQWTPPTGLTSTTCPGSGCVNLSVSGMAGVGVQITGTFVGTLQFEGSIDGVTFAALTMTPIGTSTGVTSATAGGVWSGGAGGLSVVRVRCSAYTSGTATVTIQNAQGGTGR